MEILNKILSNIYIKVSIALHFKHILVKHTGLFVHLTKPEWIFFPCPKTMQKFTWCFAEKRQKKWLARLFLLRIQGGPKNRILRFIFGITSVIQHRF